MTNPNKLIEIAKACGAVFTTKGEKTMLQVASWDERMIFTKDQLQALVNAVNAINKGDLIRRSDAIAEVENQPFDESVFDKYVKGRILEDINSIPAIASEAIYQLLGDGYWVDVDKASYDANSNDEGIIQRIVYTTKPNTADSIESTNSALPVEPVRWGLGRKDGVMDKFSAVYRTKEAVQKHIDGYGGELEAMPIPLFTAPPQVNEVLEEIEIGCRDCADNFGICPNTGLKCGADISALKG